MKGHFSRNSERTSGTSHKDTSPSKTDYKNKSQVKTVLLTERYHPPPQNIIHSEPTTTINFDKTTLYDTHPQQFGTGQQQIIFHIGFQSRLQVIKDNMNVGAPKNSRARSHYKSIDVSQSNGYQANRPNSGT